MSVKYYGTQKVGETFEYEGKVYKVIDFSGYDGVACVRCAFHTDDACREMGCTIERREDRKDVYYREVDNEILRLLRKLMRRDK